MRFLYPVGGNLMHLYAVETLLCFSYFFYLLLSDVDYPGGENCVIIFFICFFFPSRDPLFSVVTHLLLLY